MEQKRQISERRARGEEREKERNEKEREKGIGTERGRS